MINFTRREFVNYGTGLLLASQMTPLKGVFAAGKHAYADDILVDGEPPGIAPGSFTVAVLPDTQYYSEKYPKIFINQTQWVVDQQKARNISCVLHLGDVTNNNSPEQWENAAKAIKVLDGKVPYFVVPGNHDYSEGGRCRDRTTLLNDYLPISLYQDRPTFGGTYDREPDRMENSFHTFDACGQKILVLGLEFGPRRDVVRWANEIVTKYADHRAILITHAYMYFDDTRYDWAKYGSQQLWSPHICKVAKTTEGDVMDGEALWANLVSKHDNFIMTLNGHVLQDGLGRLTSTTQGGSSVHQMLVNYQMQPKGGCGWMRLLEFLSDGVTVKVYDYSPYRNQRNVSVQNMFNLNLTPRA